TVTPTAAKMVMVTCAPTAPGMFTTTFTASSGDTFGSAPVTVPIVCEGSSAPLFATPSALELGEIRVDALAMVPRTIQVQITAGTLTLAGAPVLDNMNSDFNVDRAYSSTTTPATFVF